MFKLRSLLAAAMLMAGAAQVPAQAAANVRGQRGATRLGKNSDGPSADRMKRRAMVKMYGRRQALKRIKAERRAHKPELVQIDATTTVGA